MRANALDAAVGPDAVSTYVQCAILPSGVSSLLAKHRKISPTGCSTFSHDGCAEAARDGTSHVADGPSGGPPFHRAMPHRALSPSGLSEIWLDKSSTVQMYEQYRSRYAHGCSDGSSIGVDRLTVGEQVAGNSGLQICLVKIAASCTP